MSDRPFSIRIFLPDGAPDGVRIIEKSNWTGTGVVVPRSLVADAKKRNEFARTGVYVLVGHEEDAELPTIYIGQGDPVKDRIDQHVAKKEFWSWLVFFVTRDDSLNKAHIGYLESELVKLARQTKRAKLDNKNDPQPSPLTEADAADMDSFLADMLSIFPLVGLSVFEKPKAATPGKSLLRITSKETKAEGYESAQGFVVKGGSTAVKNEKPSIHPYQSKLRKELLAEGVLEEDGNVLRLTQDYEFGSPSTAAAVLLGRASSGPNEWKDSQGRKLKEIQAMDAQNSG